jgi:hypothetical protein
MGFIAGDGHVSSRLIWDFPSLPGATASEAFEL